MYLEYFGFLEKPFGLTPDTRFVYLSNNHREGFAHLWYGLQQGGGFNVLTGDIGTGKTTLLRALLSRLDPQAWRSALIFNPAISAKALLQEILREFGLPSVGRDASRLLQILNAFLLRENAAGRSVLLILDEAQNLHPEVLEKIRLLSNLETERRKLLHIVLAGQPELAEILRQPELRQLQQRVSVQFHLRGMDEADTRRYIAHRLERAGMGDRPLFSPRALSKIHRCTLGIPRVINILCDRCLLTAFAANRKTVTSAMVAQAAAELQGVSRGFKGFLRKALPQALILGGLALALGLGTLLPFPAAAPTRRDALSMGEAGGQANASAGFAEQDRKTWHVWTAGRGVEMAFNALASTWQLPELSAGERIVTWGELCEAARDRGLEVSLVRGSLEDLLRLNYPVLVSVRGAEGLSSATIVEETPEGMRLVPAVDGRSLLSRSDLSGLWSGEAFLFWRNDLAVTASLTPGASGKQVKALQRLLSAAGGRRIRQDGIFGRETAGALAEFQRDQGLEVGETLDMATLLRLYQVAEGSEVPRLRG